MMEKLITTVLLSKLHDLLDMSYLVTYMMLQNLVRWSILGPAKSTASVGEVDGARLGPLEG